MKLIRGQLLTAPALPELQGMLVVGMRRSNRPMVVGLDATAQGVLTTLESGDVWLLQGPGTWEVAPGEMRPEVVHASTATPGSGSMTQAERQEASAGKRRIANSAAKRTQ